jgi:glyoxylase-like metal-dependent hydrolase (beta-lactamase superfamily II)
LEEGEIIDLGDRNFEVLHLPGHTPGSIGLYERASETLFSGDAIYDGPLVDMLPESDIVAYAKTLKRLRELPVRAVHGGHEPSFDGDRLIEIIDDYLNRWQA